MDKIDGTNLKKCITPADIAAAEGNEVMLCACVHKIKRSSGFYFVMLRTGRYVYQSVYREGRCGGDFDDLCEGAYVTSCGRVTKEERAPYGYEIELTSFKILSKPKSVYTPNIAGDLAKTNKEYTIAVHCRAQERAVFKINEGVTSSFRDFMLTNGFTEIYTPKITTLNMEDQKHVFRLNYFGEKAYLTQSPQLYKQAAVAFFERVFEVGSVYRADKHNSTRHLNEFVSLDFEMAYVDSIFDIMSVLTAFLKHMINHLEKNYQNELDIIGINLPKIREIPCITFYEALNILGKNRKQPDLDPTDEVKLCRWAQEQYDGSFIFVTNFPQKKRPFYAMDNRENTSLTETFDLLLDGIEIASGGQRIHDYNEQAVKLKRLGLDETQYAPYLDIHLSGIPPHGGAGVGLERLVMKLLGLGDIRQASLFPRDLHRLIP